MESLVADIINVNQNLLLEKKKHSLEPILMLNVNLADMRDSLNETMVTDKIKIQNMKTAELAEWLHDNYEEIAIKNGWNTQKNCKVKFEELPELNKKTMMSLARKIHKFV